VIFFSVHTPVNFNMAGSAGYGSSAPSILNILCLVPHILKGNDIQRQEAGILREGTEETRDRKKAVHMCFIAIFQAMERRPQNELRSSSFSPWYGLRGIPEPD